VSRDATEDAQPRCGWRCTRAMGRGDDGAGVVPVPPDRYLGDIGPAAAPVAAKARDVAGTDDMVAAVGCATSGSFIALGACRVVGAF